VDPDLELKRASRRPTDELCRGVGKADMRDELQEEADDADIEQKSVEKQKANNVAASPLNRADPKVYRAAFEQAKPTRT
jgi:hypothetical protein